MPFYVYILQSLKDKTYYKGFTENPSNRILQHNNAEMKYTSTKMPWVYVCIISFETKKEAIIAEKKIKKYDHSRLEKLILADKNILPTLFL